MAVAGRSIRVARASGPAVLTAALVLAACEGENLFVGERPVSQARPVVTRLDVPFTANAGDSVTISVTAFASRGLSEVRVNFTGALAREDRVGFPNPTDTVTLPLGVRIPSPSADSLLIVSAVARDAANQLSNARTDTMRIIGQAFPAAQRLRDER